ncbi:MAG: alkyl hydroperoxide reductase [Pseudopedobacter saltans]|uniref:Alkyl hydroperoxide reductase n=1 Tax=Pseudopedobacter saltans TaxID=151895 RepID=A0A2W5EMK9_9SPHI|nr:MAG: alkyl hydroperoxide reductase [Pseudopedobacter saltans]
MTYFAFYIFKFVLDSQNKTMTKSKRLLTLALTSAISFPVFAQNSKIDYKIEGKISGLTSGKIYLRYLEDGKRITDSTLLNNGIFEFKGQVSEPSGAVLTYSDGETKNKRNQDSKSIYLENGVIKVDGSTNLKESVVSGGLNNKDNNALQLALKPSKEKTQTLISNYYALSKEEQSDTAKTGPLERQIDEQENLQKKQYLAFIQTHKNSFVALDAVKNYAGYTIDFDDVNPIFSSLSTPIKNSVAGKSFDEKLKKVEKISIGRIAPEFTQNDTNGHPFQLTSLRGKYVLIDFWASWCGPCRAENPNVVKAYNEYKDKNFTILGVSLDQPNGKEKWINAIHKDQLYWNQVSDLQYWNNEVAQLYAVQSIPQNFLLDPSGKIIAKDLRGADLENKLASLLK